jgi:hypothetical protein
MWWLNSGNISGVKTGESQHMLGNISNFENKISVQQIIDKVIRESSADRVLILKTENGGGKPRLGSHLYSSVMYESSNLDLVKPDYQRLSVDEHYVKMLSDIGPSRRNSLITDKMKNGTLKWIYQREGIKYSEIHYIGETQSAFVYLSVATKADDNTFDEPITRVEIEIAISKLVTLFNSAITNANLI